MNTQVNILSRHLDIRICNVMEGYSLQGYSLSNCYPIGGFKIHEGRGNHQGNEADTGENRSHICAPGRDTVPPSERGGTQRPLTMSTLMTENPGKHSAENQGKTFPETG